MSNHDSVIDDETTTTPSRKMYYSISEVAIMTGLEQSQLRHWEKEFSKLRPKKNSAGKRAYREKDIELIRRIKQLLQNEKYTINGAKLKIAEERRAAASERAEPQDNVDVNDSIEVIEAEVEQTSSYGNESTPASTMSPDVLWDIRRSLQDVLILLES